jgi:hypothetical protein
MLNQPWRNRSRKLPKCAAVRATHESVRSTDRSIGCWFPGFLRLLQLLPPLIGFVLPIGFLVELNQPLQGSGPSDMASHRNTDFALLHPVETSGMSCAAARASPCPMASRMRVTSFIDDSVRQANPSGKCAPSPFRRPRSLSAQFTSQLYELPGRFRHHGLSQ